MVTTCYLQLTLRDRQLSDFFERSHLEKAIANTLFYDYLLLMSQPTPLQISFSLERLKRYLSQHPDQALEQALNYCEDFSILALEYQQLEQKVQALTAELISLQQLHPSATSPQFPSFLSTISNHDS